ncbi:MAG: ATP phosphoribosyltransferase [Planctomycetaceae bacterium]|jgi:ATP phosphoribosyltransferase|nr:ATP phosphoribosyltransferase [Planctomycetaceae bacterium]MBT4723720.1 ATP phosphoribosyltransferase [Planctomycetaceae bacterium]MBT4846687.1 ATP phosphoribosyltransferase [Planctomycetaceae bacterium]MBT5124104.1 ATP phosphoribosyltransferase [Planctomycetaceae bacterium]MBT5598504.1 ATP phosphoribosyltransferase [Planctomycetaceae bacterium]
MTTPDHNIRIGLPSKGRLSDLAIELLKEAGIRFRRQNRSLFAKVRGLPIDIIFLRTDDIPVLCAEGAIDMGITGSDLVAEANVDVDTRLSLNVGKCRLAICVPDDLEFNDPNQLDGQRIATSFTNVTTNFLAEHNAVAHLVPLSGSVEIMIALGIADVIVDLVETGSTLAANRLKIAHEIGQYETVLIQNKQQRHSEMAQRVIRRLEGVVIARGYSLLEYNIPQENLEAALKITPGFKSPTITPLDDQQWSAVRVMVKSSEITTVMDQLEEIQASAILETPINNCRL